MPQFLVYFYHRYLDFRFPEFDAVLKIHGFDDVSHVYTLPDPPVDGTTPTPFLQITLPSDDVAAKIAARCVLVKGIYTYLAQAPTYDILQDWLVAHGPLHADDASWSFWVDCFGAKLSLQDQDTRRLRLTSIEACFPGPVQLKHAACTYWLVEEKGTTSAEAASVKQIYFARELPQAERTAREYVLKHSLKKRKFIGSTSMDHELSLLMANLALVQPMSIVCDPFVGTASVLVACAQFGGVCLGGDIDAHALRGTVAGVNIFANFDQYNLPPPDLLQWDVSRPVVRPDVAWFDAIICDPPYGFREKAQAKHASSASSTAPKSVLLSLLDFAAPRLVVGGRLVYVMACQKRMAADYAAHVPTHGALRMVHLCVQEMTRKWVRLFLTMEKIEVAADAASARIGAALKDIGEA
ncbi:Aste57867_13937 [Aphanomyces stellatus]|uniref:Aste57867_13937 protein n=1 Tax=Aphanomyces stellatus TaxID=120398 RepID=A0A485KZX4_9STRA|nr:hypothetical protein As57867_013886 [Aphanomyces stellatus]VFT90767.1 Aste57867_13937 [Aphanomyces stellatus]